MGHSMDPGAGQGEVVLSRLYRPVLGEGLKGRALPWVGRW